MVRGGADRPPALAAALDALLGATGCRPATIRQIGAKTDKVRRFKEFFDGAGVEDASRRRPHLLHKSDGQPVPALSACRRLLAYMRPARRDAETLELRSRPIRHAATAPHQDRRAWSR
jgi:hypothetical protein